MIYRDFCYWLRGYIEAQPHLEDEGLTSEQFIEIKKHLDICFNCEPVKVIDKDGYSLNRIYSDCPPEIWKNLQWMPGGSC